MKERMRGGVGRARGKGCWWKRVQEGGQKGKEFCYARTIFGGASVFKAKEISAYTLTYIVVRIANYMHAYKQAHPTCTHGHISTPTHI